MNVALCDIHSTICCSRVSPSFSPYSLQQPRFAVRNPSQFRANCSLVIQKQDGQVVSNEETPSQPVSVSESFSRRLILLRHAKSSWENRLLRGIFLWESPKLGWEFLFCAYLASLKLNFQTLICMWRFHMMVSLWRMPILEFELNTETCALVSSKFQT